MIAPPASWTAHFGANLVTLYPPDGGGRIRYYERVAPLRRFSALIRYALERDPLFSASAIAEPREVISGEGEYGAWARVDGTREGTRVSRQIGALFADDYAAVIDALIALRPRAGLITQTAQDLLVNARLGRGLCHRRFCYRAPADWQVIPGGLVANWYPPDFPDNHTNVVVLPARPLERSAAEEHEANLASERARGAEVDGAISEQRIAARSGLEGRRWIYSLRQPGRDRPLHRDVVIFGDDRYSYVLRMESLTADRVDEHRAILAALARSAEPIPRPGTRTIGPANPDSTTGAFGHWLD